MKRRAASRRYRQYTALFRRDALFEIAKTLLVSEYLSTMKDFWTLKSGAVALCAWATVAVATICGSVASAADEKCEMTNSWNEGRYFALQETSISYVEQREREILARTQTRATFDWQVEAAPLRADGVRVLKLKPARVMIRLQNADADVAYYDSDNPLRGDELMKNVFQQLLKSEFVVELKDGKVLKVDGCEAFAKTLPAGENDDEKYFVAQIQTIASPSNIAQIFDPLSQPLPGKPVAVGERWTTETPFVLPALGEKKLTLDCELKGLASREPKANVVAEAVLDVELNAGASATIKIDIDGKYNLTDGVANVFASRATVNLALLKKNKAGEEVLVKAIGVIRNKLTVAKR